MGYHVPAPDATVELDDSSKKLLTMMCLPLIDGVYASLVLTGVVTTLSGIISTGLLIFGGVGMISILISEMDGDTRRQRLQRVAIVGSILMPGAALEALVAPAFRAAVDLALFKFFGAAVILSLAISIANSDLLPNPWPDLLPDLLGPTNIAGAGVILALRPFSTQLMNLAVVSLLAVAVAVLATVRAKQDTAVLDKLRPGVIIAAALGLAVLAQDGTLLTQMEPTDAVGGVLAATIAVTVGTTVAITAPTVEKYLDEESFKIGAAISLAMLPAAIFGILPSLASLVCLGTAALLSIDATEEPAETEQTSAGGDNAVSVQATAGPVQDD